jgi:hypothetical protein
MLENQVEYIFYDLVIIFINGSIEPTLLELCPSQSIFSVLSMECCCALFAFNCEVCEVWLNALVCNRHLLFIFSNFFYLLARDGPCMDPNGLSLGVGAVIEYYNCRLWHYVE